MKNILIIIGFIVCAAASFGLMTISKSFVKNNGEWAPGGVHMRHVEEQAASMMDKCRLDRMEGRLKGHKESAECSNPTIRTAFAKEGFPHMDKVDEFLTQRAEYGRKADSHEITEDEMHQLGADAETYLLDSVKPEEKK
jgi:hypothetical protein